MARLHGALLLGLMACAPPNAATPYPGEAPPPGDAPIAPADASEAAPGAVVTYFDREVDLQPFLAGFPYQRFMPSLETGELFFLEVGERYTLRRFRAPTAAGGTYDLSSAPALTDADWSKRSLWDVKPQRGTSKLWLHADESNDERMNLWTLDMDSGELTAATDHDYVYGFGFDGSHQRIAYLPRKGKKAPYETCLHLLDTASGQDTRIVCDSSKLSFTWGTPRFSESGERVYFNAQVDGDRTRVQIVEVDLTAKTPRVRPVTDLKATRNSPDMLAGWSAGKLLFRANDDGFQNLYSYDPKRKRVTQLTRFREDLTSAELTQEGVLGVHRTPAGSTLVLVDPQSGEVLDEVRLPGEADVIDAHGTSAWVTHEAPDIVFEMQQVTLGGGKLDRAPVVALPAEQEAQAVACSAEAVQIETFDRTLHAFVLSAREPLAEPTHRLALIRSFYGGRNSYDAFDQILCAAGFTVISPAVRGSTGFGQAFYSLNDKDLGGDEIVDLFYVARWAERTLDLPARRIGVYGRSHGGYATMRALTFPPKTNGRNEFYPFGFGMSDAGFSDITTFFAATNIPDWVILESGDPANPDDLARMKDRSPLTHVDRLQAPLLVTHGSKDWRVPVAESRQFVEAARARDKPVQYVEFEGQGHHVEGLSLQQQAWQARLRFLEAVAKAAPAP